VQCVWMGAAALALMWGFAAARAAPASDGAAAPPPVPSCLSAAQLALPDRAPRTMREYAGTRGWTPSELACAELEEISPELARVGTAMKGSCRWAIDQAAQPVGADPWRAMQRLLDADSRRLSRLGQWEAATDRLCAMIAVAGVMGRLDRLDARASAASMAYASVERARQFIDAGAPASSAMAVLSACDALESTGMFDPCAMIRLERIRWILRPEASAAARVPSAALVASARSEPHAKVDASSVPTLESMSPADLEIQVRAGEPWFEALASRCGGADARSSAVELDERAQRGQHGAWLQAMRPDMPWAIGELERARASVRSVRERARVAAAGAGLDAPPAGGALPDPASIPCSVGAVAVRRGDAVMRLPYRLVEPASMDEGERYPLVVFLHGAGERGDDGASALKHFADRMASPAMRERYRCYILAVQCPRGHRWVDADWSAATPPSFAETPTPAMDAVIAALRTTALGRRVDLSRIYLTGISMGGYGAWDLGARHPEWFAAAVPVCGGGDPATASRLAALPVRAVHGLRDGVVPPERTRAMVQAIRAAGGSAELVEPDCGHDAWTVAYTPEGALDWMFAQRRAQPAEFGAAPSDGGTAVDPVPSAPR
jgi:poly(3-hydroxybutyrate) depolymerase